MFVIIQSDPYCSTHGGYLFTTREKAQHFLDTDKYMNTPMFANDPDANHRPYKEEYEIVETEPDSGQDFVP